MPHQLAEVASAAGLTFSNEIGDRTFIICALLAAQGKYNVVLTTTISIIAILVVNAIAIGIIYFIKWLGLTHTLSGYAGNIERVAGLCFMAMGVYQLSKLYMEHRWIQNNMIQVNLLPAASLSWSESDSISSLEESHPYRLSTYANKRRMSTFSSRDDDIVEIYNDINDIEGGVWGLIKEVFPMIFLSEIGDKSMLTTIVLASTLGLRITTLGIIIGIGLCIPLAAFLGRVSRDWISANALDYISAISMLVIGAGMCMGLM